MLVGDSGESDPEIYGELARRHPDAVRLVSIRDVTGEGDDDVRYRAAFRDVPVERWRRFASPAELADVDVAELARER